MLVLQRAAMFVQRPRLPDQLEELMAKLAILHLDLVCMIIQVLEGLLKYHTE